MSIIKEKASDESVYMRSKITESQNIIFKKLKINAPKDLTPQSAIKQMFK
jgi:hypothetical protein